MVKVLQQIPTTEFPLISVLAAIFLILIPIIIVMILFRCRLYIIVRGGIIGLAIAAIYIPLTFVFAGFSSFFYYQCSWFTKCILNYCASCSLFFAPVIIYFEFSLLGFVIGFIIWRFRRGKKMIRRVKR